jgi:hypothetical protein
VPFDDDETFAIGDALGVAVPVVTFPFKVLFVVAFVAPAIVAHPANKTVIRSRATSGEMSLRVFMMYLANSSFMVNTR